MLLIFTSLQTSGMVFTDLNADLFCFPFCCVVKIFSSIHGRPVMRKILNCGVEDVRKYTLRYGYLDGPIILSMRYYSWYATLVQSGLDMLYSLV